ncbi:MAG: SDR family NAD(P)-dependent oxidoreductase [Chloroflexales bacterium]|nr:SDR family NAD(P)-dependent oxidoreductase [Chloroflexales bacterium]
MAINDLTNKSKPSDPGRRRFLFGAGAAAAAAAGVGFSACSPTAPAAPTAAPITGVGAENNEQQQQEQEFAGKCAFITGGARGIGFATAEVLARAGANIVLYDVAEQIEHVRYPLATAEDLANAKTEIESLGVECIAIQGDVRNGAQLKEAMDQAVSEFGSLDMVIVNAGITQVGPLDILSEEEVAIVLDVNLAGAIKTLQAAIPIMREQNSGRIVLMSSITGRAGSAGFPVYSASKWGMIGLAKGTAQLLGSNNVTCNAVCPSLVNTKLLDNDYVLEALLPDSPTIEAFNERAKQRHLLPVGLYEPIHVANTIRFICSDAAAYISGDVFDIQAGSSALNTA